MARWDQCDLDGRGRLAVSAAVQPDFDKIWRSIVRQHDPVERLGFRPVDYQPGRRAGTVAVAGRHDEARPGNVLVSMCNQLVERSLQILRTILGPSRQAIAEIDDQRDSAPVVEYV